MTVRLYVYMMCVLMVAGMAACKQATTVLFQYPPTWPLEDLRVPDGVLQINLPDDAGGTSEKRMLDGELRAAGTRDEYRIWQVAFTDPGLETEIIAHFDQIMWVQRYLLLNAGVPKYGERIYVTKDTLKHVSFKWQDSHRFGEQAAFKGYVLTIKIYSEPWRVPLKPKPIPIHGKDTD